MPEPASAGKALRVKWVVASAELFPQVNAPEEGLLSRKSQSASTSPIRSHQQNWKEVLPHSKADLDHEDYAEDTPPACRGHTAKLL